MENEKTAYVKGQLYNINITDLHTDPDQPRKYMDPQALDELAASIRQHGVLEPILFRNVSDGTLCIVAGERRYAAAQKIGLTQIPGICIEGDHAEISLVENLLRQDLTAVEEAEALDRIMKEHSYKQEDLCRMIGKATSTISEILSLNRLPQEIRDECRSNPAISKNILIEIAKSKQQRGMLSLYKKYKARNLSKEELRQHRKREKRSELETILKLNNTIIEKINKIDMSHWTDTDKETLRTAIILLNEAIQEKGFTAPPVAKSKQAKKATT